MKQVVFLMMMTAALLNAQSTNKKLVVELGVSRPMYAIGDDISITARISNRGTEPLRVYRPLLWGRRGGLVLEVIDASGHQIKPQQLDEDSVIPTTLTDPQSFLQIPSDYEWGVIRRDKTTNIFKTPGRYTLRLKYLSPVPKKYFAREGGQWATEDGPVLSEPVTIEIK